MYSMPGADQRRAGAEQRDGLPLHVRAHQRAVRVVVLKEGDERGGHRHQLLRRHVHELDLVARREHGAARLPRVDAFLHEPAVAVQRGVGLRDRVLVLLPGRQVEGVRLDLGRLAAFRSCLRVLLDRFGEIDDVAGGVSGPASAQHDHELEHPPVLDLAVGRLDEAELVDPRVAGQRGDEADVRPLRRLDRADAPVVRRVDVADLEPRALARQPPGPERGEPPLVGDLREGVGLVHELRQLRRAEELPNRRHDGLGVDQVVRHGGRHLLVDRHLLLDGPLHPHQPDPELVLEQFADRPDPAVAEVVDVVDRRRVAAQLQQELDDLVEILRVQDLLVERGAQAQLRVQLQAADPREVVLLRVEEHVLEERPRALLGRRVAGPEPLVDLDERLAVRLDRVLAQRPRQDGPDLVAVGEEDVDRLDALLLGDRDLAHRQCLVGRQQHLAGGGVDHVGGGERPVDLLVVDPDRLDLRLPQRRDRRLR